MGSIFVYFGVMASLVGARIDVTGKGPGKVEDFSKVLTGGSLHTINFDDGSKEKILLARMKLGSPNGGAEFTVIEEAEAEPSLVYGVAPTFKNSPVKPNALAVAAWKWAKPWALELDDTEIEALVSGKLIRTYVGCTCRQWVIIFDSFHLD